MNQGGAVERKKPYDVSYFHPTAFKGSAIEQMCLSHQMRVTTFVVYTATIDSDCIELYPNPEKGLRPVWKQIPGSRYGEDQYGGRAASFPAFSSE